MENRDDGKKRENVFSKCSKQHPLNPENTDGDKHHGHLASSHTCVLSYKN